MEQSFLFILFGIAGFAFFFYGYQRTKRILAYGMEYKAKVVDYENKLVKIAGTWTRLDYPTIEYVDGRGNLRTGTLKYAKSGSRPFKLDQEIVVIRYQDIYYYRDGLKSGNIYSLLIGLGFIIFGIVEMV